MRQRVDDPERNKKLAEINERVFKDSVENIEKTLTKLQEIKNKPSASDVQKFAQMVPFLDAYKESLNTMRDVITDAESNQVFMKLQRVFDSYVVLLKVYEKSIGVNGLK